MVSRVILEVRGWPSKVDLKDIERAYYNAVYRVTKAILSPVTDAISDSIGEGISRGIKQSVPNISDLWDLIFRKKN